MFENTKIVIIFGETNVFFKQNHLRKKLLVISSQTIFDDFWMKHLTKNVRFFVFASN